MYDISKGYRPGMSAEELAALGLGPPQAPAAQPGPAPGAEAAPLGPPAWASGVNKDRGRTGAPAKYPFTTMPINGTFRIEPGPKQPKFSSFRIYCIQRSKELGKRFRCHQYEDGTIEVWRKA